MNTATAHHQHQKQHPHIATTAVKSSQIAAIGYDPATQTLAVTFTGKGDTYHYANVTPAQHAAFMGAESHGKWFGEHLRKAIAAHPFTKIPKPAAHHA